MKNLYFYPLIFALWLLSFPALSQTPKADSLLHALENAKTDTTKIKLLNDLAWQLRTSNPDTAITLSTQALAMAKKINYKIGIGISFHNLGEFNWRKSNFGTALTFYNHALDIWKQLEKSRISKSMIQKRFSATLNNIGVVYWNQGDYAKALDHYLHALEIAKELGNKGYISARLGNIGIVYHHKGDYANALEHYLQALEIAKDLGNKSHISSWLGNIGLIYSIQSDYVNALGHYLQALEIDKELRNKNGVARHLGNIGNVYTEQGDYANALNNFLQALEISKELGNKDYISYLFGSIGNVYRDIGDLKKEPHLQDSLYALAMEYYRQALRIAQEIGSRHSYALQQTNIASIYIKQHNPHHALPFADTAIALLIEMHELYHLKGAHRVRSLADSALANYQSACHHFLLHMQYKDTVQGTEMQEEVGRIGKMWEIRAVEREREAKEAEETRLIASETAKRHRLQYSIILAIVVVVISLAFLAIVRFGKHIPPKLAHYLPIFIPLIIIETALLFAEPEIVLYLGDAPLVKALIYFGIALLFLPLQRWLDKLVVGSKKVVGKRQLVVSKSHLHSNPVMRFLNRSKNNLKGRDSMFAILLAIALINACGYNKNNSPKIDLITTNDAAPPLHARVERGPGGEVNQAKLDSFTVIMFTHKANFESQYTLAQKTGNSENYKIAYALLKPWSRWKDSVSSETKAMQKQKARTSLKSSFSNYVSNNSKK